MARLLASALSIVALSGVLLGSGCIFVGSTRVYTTASEVTSDEMRDLVARTRTLRVGMSREEALGAFPAECLNLKSSTTDGGSVFEEWQVEAFNDKDDVYFRRYLYLANDRLAAFSDTRIDYRENPELMRGWAR